MLPATVGLVYWKMITYCVPNDKSAQWHVALLSSPDPSLIVSVVSFLYPALALICWNDSPHIRGTNRMPSASLSLSSLYPHCLPTPTPHQPPCTGKSTKPRARGGANVVWGQGSVSAVWINDIIAARNQHTFLNTLHAPANDSEWLSFWGRTGGFVKFNTVHSYHNISAGALKLLLLSSCWEFYFTFHKMNKSFSSNYWLNVEWNHYKGTMAETFFSFCVVKKKHKRTVNSCYNCFLHFFPHMSTRCILIKR